MWCEAFLWKAPIRIANLGHIDMALDTFWGRGAMTGGSGLRVDQKHHNKDLRDRVFIYKSLSQSALPQ